MKPSTGAFPKATGPHDAVGKGDENEYTASQRSHVFALTDAATTLIDAPESNIFELTATGGVGATRQLDNPTNLVKGMAFQIWFVQDGTGGRALTFDTFYDFGAEGAPDFTGSAAGELDVISCVATTTTTIAASIGSGAPPAAHLLGSASHSADTLANLNAKVSDATLIDTADSRLSDARAPTAHLLGSASHTADTLANLNTKVSDATLIDTADSRLSDARAPTAHLLGSASHSADTFANLNTKVSDETLAGIGTQQVFSKNQRSAISALTDAATVAVDASLSNVFELTATVGIGATRALGNPTNVVAGMSWIIIYNQDGTGSRDLTFSANYDFGDEGEPDVSTDAANETIIISCFALTATQIACSSLLGFA